MDLRKRIAMEIAGGLTKIQASGYPLTQLFWECTQRCNFACLHCGSDCKTESGIKDMPFEDFRKVLQSIKSRMDCSRLTVNITGGEPLVRKDLEACGRAIYDMHISWGIVTNGWGLDEGRLRSLLEAGIHSMTISLDGIAEVHDWMRGRKGAYERAVAAIGRVCSFNRAAEMSRPALGFSELKPSDAIAFDVVSCINRRSINQLEEMKEKLISLGVSHWRLFTIFPVGRAAKNPELQLDREEFHRLMEFIKATRKEGRIVAEYACEGFLGEFEGDVRDHFYFCQAGIHVASILADGSIAACASIRSDYSQGNIYDGDDFVDIWQKGYGQYRDRSWMRRDECGDCPHFRFCKGGPMHLRDADGKLIFCHVERFGLDGM